MISATEKKSKLATLSSHWSLSSDLKKLHFSIPTQRFSKSFELASAIAHLAEQLNHHPVLHLSSKWLQCEIWTFDHDDVLEQDYVFATKVDKIVEENFL